jgi:hypothetical protein
MESGGDLTQSCGETIVLRGEFMVSDVYLQSQLIDKLNKIMF